jgi:electron transfer flavoprotein beta subunit
LKLAVLVKRVPDTETKIRIGGNGSDIVRDGVKYVMNPYDEFAVEQALKLKEQVGGDSSVTAITLGPAAAAETLRMALAMGADRAVHVCDDAFEGQDALATSRALAAAVRAEGFDAIFAGKTAIDDNASVVPTALAEVLELPHVNTVQAFELAADQKSATVRRRIDGGEEIVACPLPAVFTCEKGLNEPRYASLTGIMKAKKKPIETKNAADIGLQAAQIGVAGSGVRLVKLVPLPERGACTFIDGDARQAARQLVQLLRNQAKVV